MKIGVTISSIAHVGILTWGLLSISGPKPLVVAEVEALPIDIVEISTITKSVQGEKKADLSDEPAPIPTTASTPEKPAIHVGDTQKDIKAPRKAKDDVAPVEATKAPTPPPAKEIAKEEPVPTTEIAALNEPKVPVLEDPGDNAPVTSDMAEQIAKLQENIPTPVERPRPPKAKSAQTKDRKLAKVEPAKKTEKADKADDDTTEDKIAALLNKQDASKGGAKRSTKKASLGTKKGKGKKLSASEMDALRSAIEQCWSVPIGLSDAVDMRVTVTMKLARDGALASKPTVKATGGEKGARRAFAGSARRAVMKCAPYSLPVEKYDTWSEVVVNFDPSQMF